MERVEFGSFNEASTFAKVLALMTKSSISIKRDGDIWLVDKVYEGKCDLDWYSKDGYGKDGFNKYGYHRDGYKRPHYFSDVFFNEGYDIDGYDWRGHNKEGYDRNGYKKGGFHKDTNTRFNLEGYDFLGYDKDDYDRAGYKKRGRFVGDKKSPFGLNRMGYDRNGFDKLGLHKDTNGKLDPEGCDVFGLKDGYDRKGYDEKGYNCFGFDKMGYDKKGYNRFNFDEYGASPEENYRRKVEDAQYYSTHFNEAFDDDDNGPVSVELTCRNCSSRLFAGDQGNYCRQCRENGYGG